MESASAILSMKKGISQKVMISVQLLSRALVVVMSITPAWIIRMASISLASCSDG